jgi:hypothetical protein
MRPSPTDEHDDFLNVKDSAKDIGCGVRWLSDGANHRGFPHDRYGKALWFSRQQRAAIRAMHRVAAQPALHSTLTRPRNKAAAKEPAAASR